jgi:hypothetical protein
MLKNKFGKVESYSLLGTISIKKGGGGVAVPSAARRLPAFLHF